MEEHAFYKNIPTSVVRRIQGRQCKICGKKYDKTCIVACGIRQDEESKATFFVEIACPCSYRLIVYLNNQPSNIKEVCFMLLDQIKKRESLETSTKINKKKNNKNKSPISTKEINEFLHIMNTSKSYEEFLDTVSGTDKHKKNKNPNKKPKKK